MGGARGAQRATVSECQSVRVPRNARVPECNSGILPLWHSGAVALWHSGTLASWQAGKLARWHAGKLALWHSANALFQGLERACCNLCQAAADAAGNLVPSPAVTQKRVQYKFLYARARLDMREPDDDERVGDTLASCDSALDMVAEDDPQKQTMLKFMVTSNQRLKKDLSIG